MSSTCLLLLGVFHACISMTCAGVIGYYYPCADDMYTICKSDDKCCTNICLGTFCHVTRDSIEARKNQPPPDIEFIVTDNLPCMQDWFLSCKVDSDCCSGKCLDERYCSVMDSWILKKTN